MKNGEFKIQLKEQEILWQDKKRYFGLPISFTKYQLTEDKILFNKGLFNLVEDEVLLYRVRDMKVEEKFFDRIFGVGNVRIYSTDASHPELMILKVKQPKKVKEIISQCVDLNRTNKGVRSTEFMGQNFDDSNDDNEELNI